MPAELDPKKHNDESGSESDSEIEEDDEEAIPDIAVDVDHLTPLTPEVIQKQVSH